MRKHVYIKITPTRIELSTPASESGAVLSKTLGHDVWAQAWSNRLHSLDEALGSLVAKAWAQGARATVVYESPSAAVEVQSNFAIGKGALQAAKLAIRDGSSFNLESDPSAFVVLAQDRAGEPKRTHVLCAVDTEKNTHMVVECVERSGLCVESVTPAQALTMSETVETALGARSPEPTAALWLSAHHSAFAVASDGRIYYVRLIDLGLERLIEAMTRPISFKGALHDGDVTLTIKEARDIFYRLGVPKYDQIVDNARRIHGADLLPLIQPVLQRLIIEIKQSIRFGVDESKREKLTLLLGGAGASIPGLAKVIASEAELDLYDPEQAGRDVGEKSVSEPDAAVALARKINLLPHSAVTLRITRRLYAGLITGVAAALIVLTADAGWTLWTTRATETRIHALDPIAQRIQKRQTQYDEAANELVRARQTIENIAEQMHERANWSAWLAELTRLTPPEIRLTRLTGSYDKGAPSSEVIGVVNVASAEQTRDLITHFLAALRSCPLVDSVELGAVARNGVQDEATHGFHIAIHLVSVPTVPVIGEDGS